MDVEPPVSLDHWKALEARPPGDSLDKGVEHSEDFFCRNTTEKLPPEDLDLERQCTGPGDTTPTWWRRIWGRILSLIFKTEASAALSRADSSLSSPPNTRVHSNQPTIDTVREKNLAELAATYTDLPTFDRSPSPPPSSDTLEDPCQGGLLSCSELDQLVLYIESVGYISVPISSSDRSTARERDSTTIPSYVSAAP